MMFIGEKLRLRDALNVHGWNIDGRVVDDESAVIPAGKECHIESLYSGDDWRLEGLYEVTADDGSFGKLMASEADLLELFEPAAV